MLKIEFKDKFCNISNSISTKIQIYLLQLLIIYLIIKKNIFDNFYQKNIV